MNLKQAVSLTAKMMYQSDLANEKRLLEIIGETRSQLYERLKSAGHNTSNQESIVVITVSQVT